MLYSLYLPTAIFAFCHGMLVPILPVYAENMSDSFVLIGLVLAGDAIGMILGDLPAGGLLERFDRKWLMISGGLLIILSTLALFFTQGLLLFFLLRVLTGIGMALWNISRHLFITEITKPQERGRIIASLGGMARFGSFAGPAVGGFIAASLGLKSPFVFFSLLGLAAVGLCMFFVKLKDSPLNHQQKPKHHLSLKSLAILVKGHGNILARAGLGQLGAQLVRAGRNVMLPLYGHSVLGLSVEQIGLVLSISSFIDMSLFYVAGMIMDRWGRKYAIVPSFFLQGLGMIVVAFSFNFLSLILAASFIAIGNGLSSGTMMTLGADLAPKDKSGEFLGFWRLIGDVGAMSAPVLAGLIAQVLSLASAAFVIGLIGISASAIFAFAVPETLKKNLAIKS
ncbi:MAG: MFS transporter [Deinococcales bacterium]